MDGNWHQRTLLFDDKWPIYYKPDKAKLKLISARLPKDVKFTGMGNWGISGVFCIIAESQNFSPTLPIAVSVRNLLNEKVLLPPPNKGA